MTPDQYRREGAEAVLQTVEAEVRRVLQDMVTRGVLPEKFPDAPHVAIRAIDVDAVLSGLPTVDTQEPEVDGRLFIDGDGDLCITGREFNLVACPALDPDRNWEPLNPDVFPEIVRRWNTNLAPDAVARLVMAARQRDGGLHDDDCKISRKSNPFCNCGHDDLMSALATMETDHD